MLCVNSSYFIKNQDWKYAEGKHIGDWLGTNNFQIDDKIIETHRGKAKIIFCTGKTLYIEDVFTSQRGQYVIKN